MCFSYWGWKGRWGRRIPSTQHVEGSLDNIRRSHFAKVIYTIKEKKAKIINNSRQVRKMNFDQEYILQPLSVLLKCILINFYATGLVLPPS